MAKKKTTALTHRSEMSSLGNKMIDAAEDNRRANLQRQAIATIQEIVDAIARCDATIAHNESVKDFYRLKLAAIRSGKFSIDPYTAKVTFDLKELNERR